MGAAEKPSFLRISSLMVLLVISLKAVLSVQAGHWPGPAVRLARSTETAVTSTAQHEACTQSLDVSYKANKVSLILAFGYLDSEMSTSKNG